MTNRIVNQKNRSGRRDGLRKEIAALESQGYQIIRNSKVNFTIIGEG